MVGNCLHEVRALLLQPLDQSVAESFPRDVRALLLLPAALLCGLESVRGRRLALFSDSVGDEGCNDQVEIGFVHPSVHACATKN